MQGDQIKYAASIILKLLDLVKSDGTRFKVSV